MKVTRTITISKKTIVIKTNRQGKGTIAVFSRNGEPARFIRI